MARMGLLAVLLIAAAGSGGCISGFHYGQRMEPPRVRAITRGFTTRGQLEAAFGPPVIIELLPEGLRRLTFVYYERLPQEWTFPPAPFAPFHCVERHQSLQAMVDVTEVVRDFDFSDVTTDTSGGGIVAAFRVTTTSRPTP